MQRVPCAQHASGIGLQNSSWTNTRAGLSHQVNCFWQYNHNPPLPWITKQSWFSTLSLQIPFLLSSVRDLLFTALHAWCGYCICPWVNIFLSALHRGYKFVVPSLPQSEVKLSLKYTVLGLNERISLSINKFLLHAWSEIIWFQHFLTVSQ